MLSTIISPAKLNFARNPIFLKVSSNNYISNNGLPADMDITFNDFPDVDEIWALEYDGDEHITITFTFKTSPDNSGIQLPRQNSGESMASYVARVCTAIRKNSQLFKDFDIAVSGPASINFFSRQMNIYNLDSDDSTNISVTITASGAKKTYRPNFKAIMDIYEINGTTGDYTALGSKSASPDENGHMLFDVAEQLRPRFSPDFTFNMPAVSIVRSDMVKKFELRLAESYGSVPVIQATNVIAQCPAIYGGVANQKLGLLNSQSLSLYADHIENQMRFLTFHPNYKKVDKTQIERLYFYNYTGASTLKIKVTAMYTGLQEDSYYNSITATASKVLELNTSVNMLYSLKTWATYTDSLIYAFKVQLFSTADIAVSEERVYEIDSLHYTENKYFIFLNSLGGFDTLRCMGDIEKSANYQRVDAIKILDASFTNKSPQYIDYNISEVQTYKARTGWLSLTHESGRTMADYLRELFLSPIIYQITNDGPERIKITSGDVFIQQSEQNLHAIGFEYRKTFTDEVFSPASDDPFSSQNTFFGTGFGSGFVVPPYIQNNINANTNMLNANTSTL